MLRPVVRYLAALALPVFLVACGSDPAAPADPQPDTGVPEDVTAADVSDPDTGAPDADNPDTATPDAAPTDAKNPEDVSAPDAGDPDATASDGATTEGGTKTDAGMSEAGTDATPGDAGPEDVVLPDTATDDIPCPMGQVGCGGRCTNTATDPANCGACGMACPMGQACTMGHCAATCDPPRRTCPSGASMACVDPSADVSHCGRCGNACPSGQACVAGVCGCPAGRLACPAATGACVDPMTDAANCGRCGIRCPSGESCVGGACTGPCVAPRMMCTAGGMTTCVNLQTDASHCGACGTACPMDQSCVLGRCQTVCPMGQSACGTPARCVNTQTDTSHCGRCGNACPAGQACVAGACGCPMGQSLCGTPPRCANTASDPAHCGRCGNACPAAQVCVMGRCGMAPPPPNDLRANAVELSTAVPASTVMVHTGSARNDTNSGGACSCTTGPDVFYRFVLARPEIVYADTLGSAYDASLFLQDATGRNLRDPGLPGGATCNDDRGLGCAIGIQAMLVARLPAGTYYLVVSGCGAGAATVHFQHLPVGNGTVTQVVARAGTQTFRGTTAGTGVIRTAACCSGGPENTYWFVTCPDFMAQTFSATTCGAASFDTELEQRSATRTMPDASVCNDDSCGLQSLLVSTLPAGAGLHTLYADSCSSAGGNYSVAVTFGRECPGTETRCGPPTAPVCVDTATSNSHCGGCGNACPAGRTCRMGGCICGPGSAMCGSTCVNLQTDNAHCGRCANACAMGQSCSAGVCRPANDQRTNAVPITLLPGETTVLGTTVNATRDGPTVPCGCTDGANVWYRFTLAQTEVVYLDTAGTSFDSSLLVTDGAGIAVPAQRGANAPLGLCNDDARCTSGGFTANHQAQTAGVLAAGTYYVAVGGCAAGPFTLHLQHLPTTTASFFYTDRFQGNSAVSTFLVGMSRSAGMCGGTASGEDARWFVTCGAQRQFFSLCRSDGGTYSRRRGSTDFDPVVYVRSALTNAEVVCNDDAMPAAGLDCRGTGGDAMQYGSRVNNVLVPRGLNAVYVDELSGGSGMTYTLRHTLR